MTSSATREYRERLIDEVKKFPVLYDTQHEAHRDIDARDRCWADIARRLGANSELLKREWKILRDSLRQSMKKCRKGATTKAGAPCRKWRFHARMAFVLPYMTRRSERPVLRDGVKLDAEPEPATPEHEPEGGPDEARPRGAGGAGGAEGAAPGSLELFFASVCQSARRLPAHAQANLKRQVLEVLLRAEEDWRATPHALGDGDVNDSKSDVHTY
ncbi:uncharacterized protein LOC113231409 isoform X2 [Hyposmocoma kahamanoa]|nr:uncharacterized protein LOC113231409 isoform X2 [Hyposmocoma kahamanoa]XP_026321504.1 uncharacterized protein LOC113231409 isoform X2 [Hyposmocoma kahamanoa]